jgi:tape measure domain-containing protein
MAANATNIRLGLTITDYQANFKAASAITNQFVSEFKAGFNGLKGSADAPAGAMNSLSRQLTVTKRQIQDLVAAGGTVPTELTQKYALLQNAANAARGAFSIPASASTPYQALTQRLDEAKTKIRDLAAEGKPVPGVLATEFRGLESQVAKVNREFDKLPTKQERLAGIGSTLQGIGRTASIVSAGIALIGVTSFKSYADINALQLGLENITGSAAGAQARFSELKEVIRLPGLGLEEAVKGDVKLQAVGFSANTAKQALLQFGNAIALTGGGKFELDSVITQLTQMGSKAKVLAEDLKPIINASPAVAKAIKDMFGTVDSEQIQAQLAATGRTPMNFIEDLIGQLSKLERVKGGPKNALENLGDSIKLAGFEAGKAADETLGLTGIIDGLGNAIGGLAQGFSSLSPVTKGLILGVVGVTAAVGPLSYAIGTLITAGPAVKAAFGVMQLGIGAILSPIGLAVIGISALGIALYNANKPFVELATKTQTLSDITKAANGTIVEEKTRLDQLYKTATDDAKSKDERKKAILALNALSPAYLGFLNEENIKSTQAAEAIRKQADAITYRARASAAEGKLVELQKKRLEIDLKPATDFERPFVNSLGTNPLNPIVQPQVSVAARVNVKKMAESEKAEALKSYDDQIEEVNKYINLNQRRADRRGIQLDPPKVEIKPFDYKAASNANKSLIQGLKDEKKALATEIANDNLKGLDTSAKVARYKELTAQIDQATASTKKQRVATEGAGSALTTNERILKRLTKELKEQGDNASPALKASVAQFQDLVKAEKELANNKPVDLGDKLKGIEKVNGIKQALLDVIDPLNRLDGLAKRRQDILSIGFRTLGFFNAEIDKIRGKIASASIGKDLVSQDDFENLKDYVAQVRKAQDAVNLADFRADKSEGDNDPYVRQAEAKIAKLRGLGVSVTTSSFEVAKAMKQAKIDLRTAGLGLLSGFAEGFGQSLVDDTVTIKDVLKNSLKTILGLIGDYLIKQGTALALAGIIGTSAAALAGPFAPLFALPAAGQISAGAGLVIGGGVIKGLAAFANGGLVYGPTIGLVGEGIGTTRNNPEVIAPLDKLQSMIGKTRGPEVFITDMILENEHIRVAFNRANARYNELN